MLVDQVVGCCCGFSSSSYCLVLARGLATRTVLGKETCVVPYVLGERDDALSVCYRGVAEGPFGGAVHRQDGTVLSVLELFQFRVIAACPVTTDY